MNSGNNIKIISIISLVVAIVGMSLGFAAFSTTLNISSSASVKPKSSDFSVVLRQNDEGTQNGSRLPGKTNSSSTPYIANISDSAITGMGGNLLDRGQYISYQFYFYNKGKYNAYLKNIVFHDVEGYDKSIVCAVVPEEMGIPSDMVASEELVNQACAGIKVSISSDGIIIYDSTEFDSTFMLPPGYYYPVIFKIEYLNDAVLVDGIMELKIGKVSFEFSSAG